MFMIIITNLRKQIAEIKKKGFTIYVRCFPVAMLMVRQK